MNRLQQQQHLRRWEMAKLEEWTTAHAHEQAVAVGESDDNIKHLEAKAAEAKAKLEKAEAEAQHAEAALVSAAHGDANVKPGEKPPAQAEQGLFDVDLQQELELARQQQQERERVEAVRQQQERAQNPWNVFQHAHAGLGYSPSQMERVQSGRGEPTVYGGGGKGPAQRQAPPPPASKEGKACVGFSVQQNGDPRDPDYIFANVTAESTADQQGLAINNKDIRGMHEEEVIGETFSTVKIVTASKTVEIKRDCAVPEPEAGGPMVGGANMYASYGGYQSLAMPMPPQADYYSAEGQGERKKGEFRIEDSDVAEQAERPPGPVNVEAPAGDTGMLLNLCLKAAEQIMLEVEGAKSNEKALQSLGRKANDVKQHLKQNLLEPGAKTIHEEKYSELLQILKAAQILVVTRGKSSLYDAVFGRASKVKAEIDNTKEQLKDWVQLNLAREVANTDAHMDQLSLAEPTSPAEPTGEHLTYQC
jgi:hypothetical protein